VLISLTAQRRFGYSSIPDIYRTKQMHHVVAIFTVLALYTPFVGNLHTAYPSELWSHSLTLAGLTLIGFFAPTASFAGPLQFGYLEYVPLISTFSQRIPDWSPYAILLAFSLLPISRLWMMGALPVVWQYILQQYRNGVRDITIKVKNDCSRAMLAANNAREHARAAAEYEKQAMDAATSARRDARLRQALMITDFFDQATHSWAALGRVTAPAEASANAAKEAVADARTVMSMDAASNRSGMLARALYEKASAALTSANDAENQAKDAQARIRESRHAKERSDEARQKEIENAADVVSTARTLTNHVATMSAPLLSAIEGAENVRRLAEQATAAAVQGNMKNASSLARDTKDMADRVVEAAEQLSAAREETRNVWLELHLGDDNDD